MLGTKLEETRVFREAKEEEARSLVYLQLEQKFDALSDALKDRINALSLDQLQALAIAPLRFASIDDLTNWLDHQG
ncbi:DUF4351 domain-containing protein [Alkalinema sp. FACHB-956]|uniref:DUF4351 domain-containing protein n=1 Tax=Alkalinema sp. FACHB-956 TaxID=2692768 RepID=UPI001683DDE2|nr:DUF4351 domain-containing protein [Alkalinema sp. FACHB-956]MBD2327770.1 DUF4351 domain-containing protein [Alkalinema sp. FACHB-956]